MIVNDGALKLSNVFGHIITSGHNQNIILLLEGKPGTGKSYAAMDLAIWTSIKLQKKFGGKPSDYFNIGHMAILMPDEIIRVTKNIKRYGIYIFDDFGVGYSARNWSSDTNKALNNVLETMRTNNNILIMTVPDSDFIDKIGRNLLHFKIIMRQAMFDLGITLGKVTVEEKQYNTQSKKILHPYLKTKTEIYNHAVFGKPPDEMCKEYDKRRLAQLSRLNEQTIKILQDDEDKKFAEFQNGGKLSQKQVQMLNRDSATIVFDGFVASGKTELTAYEEVKKHTKGGIPSLRTLQRNRKRMFSDNYPDTPMTQKQAKTHTTPS